MAWLISRCATLRLVSNYGFLEDPIRLLRAVRLGTRLGWLMDERTKQRFDNAMEEGVFSQITNYQRGYELEEIGHEENPLEMLRTLEDQGWMKQLYPAWTVSKADAQGLAQLHELQTRLQIEGIYPDISAAAMELLTARMQPKDIAGLKKLFVRPGFVKEWEKLDKEAEAFGDEADRKRIKRAVDKLEADDAFRCGAGVVAGADRQGRRDPEQV